MHKLELLYEPLPIVRLGIKKETEDVVIGHDFSCFAKMLEEYISYGAVKICMPQSAPEISSLDKMPTLLKKRIKIVDDNDEIDSMRRILHGLRKELEIKISDEDQHLKFKKDTPFEISRAVNHVHAIVKKLAIGFNHGVQIDVNPEASIKSLRYLRMVVKDFQARVVLAQLEALMGLYEGVNFKAPTPPKDSAPLEIISVFDRLINDQTYLEYSDYVAQLADPSSRNKALIQIRDLERGVKSLSFVSTGWNYAAKLIQAWSGVPVPESNTISNLIHGRSLPAFIDLQAARENAVDMWKKSELVDTPLGRDGKPLGEGEIIWVPPFGSMEIYSSDNKPFSLGKVSELLEALKKSKEYFEKQSGPDV